MQTGTAAAEVGVVSGSKKSLSGYLEGMQHGDSEDAKARPHAPIRFHFFRARSTATSQPFPKRLDSTDGEVHGRKGVRNTRGGSCLSPSRCGGHESKQTRRMNAAAAGWLNVWDEEELCETTRMRNEGGWHNNARGILVG